MARKWSVYPDVGDVSHEGPSWARKPPRGVNLNFVRRVTCQDREIYTCYPLSILRKKNILYKGGNIRWSQPKWCVLFRSCAQQSVHVSVQLTPLYTHDPLKRKHPDWAQVPKAQRRRKKWLSIWLFAPEKQWRQRGGGLWGAGPRSGSESCRKQLHEWDAVMKASSGLMVSMRIKISVNMKQSNMFSVCAS